MASGNLRTISVSLVARTAKFARDMKRAGRSATSFSKKVGRIKAGMRGLGSIGVTALSGLSFAGLGASIGKTVSGLDAAAKSAKKLGFESDSLLAFRYAANRSGIAVSTFDMAMQRMVRRVGEAAKGMGEARAALAEMGLDATKLANMRTDEMFLRIADGISKGANEADRLRLSFKLFDSEGAALVLLAEQGEKGIQRLIDRAHALGLTLRGIDVGAFEKIKDAVGDLAGQMHGDFATIIGGIAGIEQGEVGGFGDHILALRRGIRGKAEEMKETIRFGVPALISMGSTGLADTPDNEARRKKTKQLLNMGRIAVQDARRRTISDQADIFRTGSLAPSLPLPERGGKSEEASTEEIKAILSRMEVNGVTLKMGDR